MKVVIAAAGTGGHINPGIAIANKIKQEQPESQIIFIGTERGLEKDLVPRAGYELKTIDSYGISREISLKNIKRLFKTMLSIISAKKILKDFEPDIVIGTGGYICISVCTAARKLKIPYIMHESNVLPGVATKMLSKNAAKVLLGFEEAKEKLPIETNTVLTGTPTKVKNLELSVDEIEQKKFENGLDSKKPMILVFGGSQGAKSINQCMEGIIKNSNSINYQIVWAAGPEQYEIVKNQMLKSNINVDNLKGIKVVPYIYDMSTMMSIADLLVCRSGAMAITEIEKIGKPSILVPFPYAAENHQEYNARVLEKAGAAKVILDKELTTENLTKTLQELTNNKNKLKEMGQKAKELSINNVEDRIYSEIKETLKDRK